MRTMLLLATGAVALFNGSEFSPFHGFVAHNLYLTGRNFPLVTGARMVTITPLAIAFLTLMIAGIPAALYERIRGLRTSTSVSIGIWAIATALLSLPTLMNALARD